MRKTFVAKPRTPTALRLALARHELALQTAREFEAEHTEAGNHRLAAADRVQAAYFSAKCHELKRQLAELGVKP